MEGCLSCGRGFCHECHEEENCPCVTLVHSTPSNYPNTGTALGPSVSPRPRGRPETPDEFVVDPRSTMRKRAQKILRDTRNVNIGDTCEWSGLANVGGGRHPIVGCRGRQVSHIHHGPDKDWFNNDPSNLSGICNYCHNRWHSRNDDCYDPDLKNNPHPATEEELVLWNDGKRMPPIDHEDCESIMVSE